MFSKVGPLTLAALATLLAWSDAGAAEPVPPVPKLSLEGVAPEIREAALVAHANALAEPENGRASGQLGMVLQANSLPSQAIPAYERAISLQPREFAWHYYLALALQETSMLEEAADRLTEALRIRPDYPAATIKLGDLLLKLGHVEESGAALEPVVGKYPKSAEALYLLGRVKDALGDFAAAEDLYRRAVQAYPSYGAAYYGLAVTGRRLGHEAESARNFALAERHQDNVPHNGDPLLKQMSELGASTGIRIRRALESMQLGELREASQLFHDVLEQEPNHLDSLLGVLFIGPIEGQPSEQEMAAYYERARRIAPENPKLYMYYGAVLRNYRKNDDVIATLNKAIELKPDYAPAHTLLGAVLEEEKRPDEAIEHYRLALAALPSYRLARVQLTQALVRGGLYNEAIPELHLLLKIDDSATSVSMVYLAIAYANSGDLENAEKYIREARTRVEQRGPPALLEEIQAIEQGLRRLGAGR